MGGRAEVERMFRIVAPTDAVLYYSYSADLADCLVDWI